MTRTVYTVTARTGGGSTWTPIGTATVEADGTIAIELDALPAAGRLVLPPEGAGPATGARSPEVSSKETSLPSLAAVERATLHTQTRRGRSVRSDATLVPDTVDTAQAFADATVRQKILLVAATLGEWFRVGDLVVACWRLWPKSFGLSGYLTQYPDASKVTAKLAGPTGLVGLGWLDRLDTHVYAVTTRGRSKARYLMATVTRAA